jgi:hypothetical protein
MTNLFPVSLYIRPNQQTLFRKSQVKSLKRSHDFDIFKIPGKSSQSDDFFQD